MATWSSRNDEERFCTTRNTCRRLSLFSITLSKQLVILLLNKKVYKRKTHLLNMLTSLRHFSILNAALRIIHPTAERVNSRMATFLLRSSGFS